MRSRVQLRSTDEIPDPYGKIFEEYSFFNGVQSTVFDDVLNKDDSVVVTAPTGSGKTVIFELAIVKLLMYPGCDSKFKIIYMAPVKALCSERFIDWQSKFTPLGLRCSLVTGDTDVDGDVTDLTNLQNMDVVVTTPEKWDFLTRRWRDHQQLMNSVRLFLIDEVHLLNDKSRGHVLEAVISRMKMIQHQQQATDRLRFIAVSATVENSHDLAAWLGSISEPAIYYAFGEEMRPVTLKKVVKGYDLQASGFRFDMNLSYKVEAVLKEYSEGKPALVFCSTRKGVFQTSQILSQMKTFRFSVEQQQHLNATCEHIVEGKLRDLVRQGIGYHHAGMPPEDRIAVENVFRKGHLPVLVATSTLAMGVNLPAHLVILKNTQFYNQGKYEEYSDNQILQMIGRAGRPQFDSSATAVIMTRPACVERFQRLVSGCDPVRSWLQNQIVEHLNAEIVLGSVRNLDDAVEWLKSTFYWVCAVRQPKKYGLPANLTTGEIEIKLQEMILKELSQLETYQLVKLVENFETKQTPYGRIMARYYVSFDTMKLFLGMSGRETLVQLLDLLTRCAELSDVTLRMHEKRPLNDLNGNNFNRIRFPLPGKIVNKHMKISCLIQAVLGCLNLHEYSLVQDSLRTVRVCQRLSRCLYEVTAEKGFMSTQRSAAILAKCLRCQMWEDSPFVSRQLPKIGVALSGLLVATGKTTLDSLVTSNPRDLERILNRYPPMGDEIRNSAASIARLQVQIIRTGNDVLEVQVTRRILPLFAVGDDHHHWFVLMVGGSDDKLLFQKRFAASDVGYSTAGDQTSVSNAALTFSVYLKEPVPTKVHAFLLSEMWVGVDNSTTLFLKEVSEDADNMFCDVPDDCQEFTSIYGSKTSARTTKKTSAQAITKTAATPAPKKTSALKKIPASKKTPAPKKTQVPKRSLGQEQSPTLKKIPAATPKISTSEPSDQKNSSDIRRFFPSIKQQNAIPTHIADTMMEEEELPEPWRPSGSIFENLRKDEDELPEPWRPSGRTFENLRKGEDTTELPIKQRTCLTSPAVINIDSPEETSNFDELVETAVSSATTRSKYKTIPDEYDNRIINCGFDAFMAEAIKEAEAEKDNENRPDEDDMVEPTPQSEIERPEPRCFGGELTNMPSNRYIISVNDMSEFYQRATSNSDEWVVPAASSAATRSEYKSIADEDDNRIIDCGFDAFMAEAIKEAEAEKDNENRPDEDMVESTPQSEIDRPEPRCFGRDLTNMPSTSSRRVISANDRSEFYQRDDRYDKSGTICIEDESPSFTGVDSGKETITYLGTRRVSREPDASISTGDRRGKSWIDRSKFEAVSTDPQEELRIFGEGGDSIETIDLRNSPWIDSTKADYLPNKCETINENYSDFTSTTGHRDRTWTDLTKAADLGNSHETRNQENGDFVLRTDRLQSSWTGRTRVDSVRRNEHENINEEFSRTSNRRESRWSDGTKSEAVPENSYECGDLGEDYNDFIATTGHRGTGWTDTTHDADKKNSYDYDNINEGYDFDSTISLPWVSRTDDDADSINSYESEKPTITPGEDCRNFTSRINYKESPWMDRRKVDADTRCVPEYKTPTQSLNKELGGFTSPMLYKERSRKGRTMTEVIPQNWYYGDESAEEEHIVYTAPIGVLERKVGITSSYSEDSRSDTERIVAFPKNPNASKRPKMIYKEQCNKFPPAIGKLESPWRVDAVPTKKSVTNFTPKIKCDSESSKRRESTLFTSDVDAGYKSSINTPNITVQDDTKINLIMGRGSYSRGHTQPDRRQYVTAPKASMKGTSQKWESRPSTSRHLDDIFPIIDVKLENGMNRKDDSRYGLDIESDCFASMVYNTGWDGHDIRRSSFNDRCAVSLENLQSAPLPKAGTRFGYNNDVHRRESMSRDFSPTLSSALSEDSGFSANSGNRTSQYCIADTHGRKRDISVKGIIAELGLPPLPCNTNGADRRDGSGTSRRNGAVQAFDDFISRETSGQLHSSETRNIPSPPKDPNPVAKSSLLSSIPGTPNRHENEGRVFSNIPQPLTPFLWSTPRLSRLKEHSTSTYNLPHLDHVNSSLENVIASAEAEPNTTKRHGMFGNAGTEKRMRLFGKPTIPATATLQNPEHTLTSQSLQNESNLPHVNNTTAKTTVSQSHTKPTPASPEWENLNLKSLNDGQQDLPQAPSQLSETDKVTSETDTSLVAAEKSQPVVSRTTDTALTPNVSGNNTAVPTVCDQRLSTSEQSMVSPKPKNLRVRSIPNFSTSPKIPKDQNINKAFMFPPSLFSSGTVPKASSQQNPLTRPTVFKPKPVKNLFVKNINKISNVSSTFLNGDRTTRARFKPPPRKSQSAATNQ